VPICTRKTIHSMNVALAALQRKRMATSGDGDATAEIVALQAKIEAAERERAAAPPCPFCCGPFERTPTHGRLSCVDCGSIALRGACEVVRHTEGRRR